MREDIDGEITVESGGSAGTPIVASTSVRATLSGQLKFEPRASNACGSAALSIVPTSSAPGSSASVTALRSEEAGPSLVSLNLNRLWERCLQRVRPQIEPHIFTAYLAPLRLLSFDASSKRCVLSAPSRFVSNYIEQNLRRSLESLIGSVFLSALTSSPSDGNDHSSGVSIEISVESERGPSRADAVWMVRGTPPVTSASRPTSQRTNSGVSPVGVTIGATSVSIANRGGGGSSAALGVEPIKSFLSSRYRFDNFVVGSNSQFVHAAALQISEQPGQQYNPFFIYGGVGLGKTHLLHAIGNALIERNPQARVLYLSSETFTNELIQSLRIGKMEDFKTRLRTIDLLLIDDIQFISGKERTQEEFFHTFNALYSARKQIVLTADKMPQDMPGIEERLQTRFTWGLAADLQAPDFETRVAIVSRKCAAEGLELSSEISHFIADKVSSNVRELEGVLTRLQAYSSLQRKGVDLAMAELALKPFTQKRAVTLSSEDIKRAVANHFGVRTSEMVSKTRTKSISFPRHVAMFLCRKHTTLSYPEIGGEFGGRDHSSVIHAANVVAGKIKSDQEIRRVVQEIENRLMGS